MAETDWRYVQRNKTNGQYRTTDEGGGGGNIDDVQVNGTSVVDGNKIAQITSYKEITQQQYENLPDTKFNDNIAYFIKDSTEAEGYPPLIYSDSEREIGVWRDGKPLYQITKVVNAGSTISVSGLSVKHAFCYAITTSGTYRALPYNDGYYTVWWISNDAIQFAARNNDISNYTITYQYTKDSDTPGGGLWAGNGAIAHHYSLEETIIGTWIDGKPLYETVYNLSSSINPISDGVTISSIDTSNMENIISCQGMRDGSSSGCMPLMAIKSSNALKVYSLGTGYLSGTKTIVLQYTKTTD